jgi:hypothetical protein
MDRESRRRFEEFRRSTAGEAENTVIAEFLDGEMDRTEFIRRGSQPHSPPPVSRRSHLPSRSQPRRAAACALAASRRLHTDSIRTPMPTPALW